MDSKYNYIKENIEQMSESGQLKPHFFQSCANMLKQGGIDPSDNNGELLVQFLEYRYRWCGGTMLHYNSMVFLRYGDTSYLCGYDRFVYFLSDLGRYMLNEKDFYEFLFHKTDKNKTLFDDKYFVAELLTTPVDFKEHPRMKDAMYKMLCNSGILKYLLRNKVGIHYWDETRHRYGVAYNLKKFKELMQTVVRLEGIPALIFKHEDFRDILKDSECQKIVFEQFSEQAVSMFTVCQLLDKDLLGPYVARQFQEEGLSIWDRVVLFFMGAFSLAFIAEPQQGTASNVNNTFDGNRGGPSSCSQYS